MLKRLLLSLSLLLVVTSYSSAQELHRFQREYILGTSFELVVSTDGGSEKAEQVEREALKEIARLDAIFSRYRTDSELMRWQRGELSAVSDELSLVLKASSKYRDISNGAFDPRAIAFSDLWKECERQKSVPSDEKRQYLLTQLKKTPFQFSSVDGAVTRNDSLPISLDGIAKGFILDQICEVVMKNHSGVQGLLINIGGDLRKVGQLELPVTIAYPFQPSQGAEPFDRWSFTEPGALATSGGYHRYIEIAGAKWSHLVDPVLGLPARDIVSVSVIAKTAMEADALATALSVMQRADAIRCVEALDGVSCLIVEANGSVSTIGNWPTQEQFKSNSSVQKVVKLENDESAKSGLHVKFTLSRPDEQQYRRPYVAIWLEDQENFPVKTAVLWLQKEQPGPQWHRDLTRWYRNDRLRKIHEKTDLIATESSATRGPGEYDAHFDGTDNLGEPLKTGKYTLCIEAAREHGTYQIIRQAIEWGDTEIKETELPSNTEIAKASYVFHPQDQADSKNSSDEVK